MKVPAHLHHVRPSSRTIEEARRWIKEGRKLYAIKAILLDSRNNRVRRVDGYILKQEWSLDDSKQYVEQVLGA